MQSSKIEIAEKELRLSKRKREKLHCKKKCTSILHERDFFGFLCANHCKKKKKKRKEMPNRKQPTKWMLKLMATDETTYIRKWIYVMIKN